MLVRIDLHPARVDAGQVAVQHEVVTGTVEVHRHRQGAAGDSRAGAGHLPGEAVELTERIEVSTTEPPPETARRPLRRARGARLEIRAGPAGPARAGGIMAERRCTADEAFAILAKLAEYSHRELRDVADGLTLSAGLTGIDVGVPRAAGCDCPT
jgi:ANTAR domain-containing protein